MLNRGYLSIALRRWNIPDRRSRGCPASFSPRNSYVGLFSFDNSLQSFPDLSFCVLLDISFVYFYFGFPAAIGSPRSMVATHFRYSPSTSSYNPLELQSSPLFFSCQYPHCAIASFRNDFDSLHPDQTREERIAHHIGFVYPGRIAVFLPLRQVRFMY